MKKKAKIIERVHELFQRHGAKSVTMDDVCDCCGISKKTLYQLYPKKELLLLSIVNYTEEEILKSFALLRSMKLNPIEEVLESHKEITKFLKTDNDIFLRQLMKYYPEIYKVSSRAIHEVIESYFTTNLENGMSQGFYRNDIDVPFLTELLFINIVGVKSSDFFNEMGLSDNEAVQKVLIFFLNSIMTEKGQQFYHKIQHKYAN